MTGEGTEFAASPLTRRKNNSVAPCLCVQYHQQSVTRETARSILHAFTTLQAIDFRKVPVKDTALTQLSQHLSAFSGKV
jgi:hypothetical protein